MFKVQDLQLVMTEGRGVAGGHYGFVDLVWCEKEEGVMQWMPLNETSESTGGSGAPGGAASKLFTESSGNGGDVGQAPVVESDEVSGSRCRLLPRERTK